MIPNWNIPRWISQVIPYMLRTTAQVAWVNVLLTPVSTLKQALLDYRAAVDAEMLPNGQTLSLEWYLNSVFDPSSKRIYIVSGSELIGDTIIYNAAEALSDPYVYKSAETPPIAIFLRNDSEFYTGNFFIVYVPAAINNARINYQINRLKLAGTTYQIVTT